MNTSTTLFAAYDSVIWTHVAIFLIAIAVVFIPLALVCYFAERGNKARLKRHQARVAADERFDAMMRELNRQRDAAIMQGKINAVMKNEAAVLKPAPDVSGRRRFLPLNPSKDAYHGMLPE